jgi:molybdopterin/thiamine biosynthesis adenylyltransferase
MSDKLKHETAYRGKDYQDKLVKLVTICGVGSLGSLLADNLVRQGFSKIRAIDMDRVEIHNLNTQIWVERDIGSLKVAALKTKVFASMGTEIETIDKELTAANTKQFLKGSALVVDCFDNSKSRQLLQDYCRAQKIPLIHGGMYDAFGECVWDNHYKVPKDGEGDVCDYPLARNLIMIVVAIMAEEILDFFLENNPRHKNWSITLKDLTIKELRLSIAQF